MRSWSAWENCSSSQLVSSRVAPGRSAKALVRVQASGRASETCTFACMSRSSWKSTTHWDSEKPLGLVSSETTSGAGTTRPSRCRMPATVLVPERPAPATRTRRLVGAGSSDAVWGDEGSGSMERC